MQFTEYQVCWQNHTTKAHGRGTATYSLEECSRICDRLNKERMAENITHWPEPVWASLVKPEQEQHS